MADITTDQSEAPDPAAKKVPCQQNSVDAAKPNTTPQPIKNLSVILYHTALELPTRKQYTSNGNSLASLSIKTITTAINNMYTLLAIYILQWEPRRNIETLMGPDNISLCQQNPDRLTDSCNTAHTSFL